MALQPERAREAIEEVDRAFESMYEALSELVALKTVKDTRGKTPFYMRAQPQAWTKAREALDQVDKLRSVYGGA